MSSAVPREVLVVSGSRIYAGALAMLLENVGMDRAVQFGTLEDWMRRSPSASGGSSDIRNRRGRAGARFHRPENQGLPTHRESRRSFAGVRQVPASPRLGRRPPAKNPAIVNNPGLGRASDD